MNDAGPEIMIIGAAILDVLVRPAGAEVFQSGSYPAEDILLSPGGDALNEATVLAGHGKKILLETVIGTDQAGRFLREYCRERGILLREDCFQESIPTGINVVLVDERGERHFLTNPAGTLRRLTLSDIHMPFPDSAKILCFASIFVFPEIGPGELEQIFKQAKTQGKIVCADMTKRKKGERAEDLACALRYVDYLIPNEEEALLLTGEKTAEEAAKKLRNAGAKNVIVKCADRGCYLDGGDRGVWIPAEPGVTCVDTTGAGDSFTAGFLYGLSEGKEPEACAKYGNRWGAKAVAVLGATEWVPQKFSRFARG